jgi:hypothetical protein
VFTLEISFTTAIGAALAGYGADMGMSPVEATEFIKSTLGYAGHKNRMRHSSFIRLIRRPWLPARQRQRPVIHLQAPQ